MTRSTSGRAGCRTALVVVFLAAMIVVGMPGTGSADDFERMLQRVDKAISTNPQHVVEHALDTCANRRQFAVKLYYAGHPERAERSLRYCMRLLKLSEIDPTPPPLSAEEIEARARVKARDEAWRELDRVLGLTPNIRNGRHIYRGCAACHTPEGWGLASGIVPQIAGQHHKVIIKQLADIRAGNRANRMMVPYSSIEAIGGPQSVADVAGYIGTLEITVENGKGPGEDLELGEKVYAENCVRCHGAAGEGDNDKFVPRIQAQHFDYLLAQFEQIRDGLRRNADPEMVKQIKDLGERETRAVLDWVSRLEPPLELQAPPGWRNPDFDDAILVSQKP